MTAQSTYFLYVNLNCPGNTRLLFVQRLLNSEHNKDCLPLPLPQHLGFSNLAKEVEMAAPEGQQCPWQGSLHSSRLTQGNTPSWVETPVRKPVLGKVDFINKPILCVSGVGGPLQTLRFPISQMRARNKVGGRVVAQTLDLTGLAPVVTYPWTPPPLLWDVRSGRPAWWLLCQRNSSTL